MLNSGKNKNNGLILRVSRCKGPGEEQFLQSISLPSVSAGESIAGLLDRVNNGSFLDINGNPIAPIRWECSCLQRKCGACAMLINGTPRLACDTFAREFLKKGIVTLEPLKKFPLVADLVVDRSILMDNLTVMKQWVPSEVRLSEKRMETAYSASRCLQCGCCLEVCPNYSPLNGFFGAAGFVPAARLLNSLTGEQRAEIKKAYVEHIYEGCGKSLACEKICPAEINISDLLVRSNAIALWKKA